ncbi:hypothetical protein MKX01_012248 [Papaver californicum]|nr:hypothetical protein MKX01_012248 [Papaver californicum]
MDDSRKDSRLVIKPSSIPRLLPSSSDLKQKISARRESNENEEDLITNHMSYSSPSSKLQNPKKPSTPKHFMSPTISAASKISTPRKKILMERNDFSFSETKTTTATTHVSKSPNLDSKTPNSSSQIPLSQKITDFSVPSDLQSSQTIPISSKLTDSEETPYDPKTNFLSPRPKFLRYNPNRRVEILKRRENELKQQADQSGSDEQESDDVSSSSKGDESGLSSSTIEEESITKKGPSEHDGSEVEIEEEEEEEEEVDEEEVEKIGRLWNLYQVIKFLVLLGVVGFSTFYISSMNAPNLQLQPVCYVNEGFKTGLHQFGLEKSILWNVSSNEGLVMKKASNIKEVELEKVVEINGGNEEIAEQFEASNPVSDEVVSEESEASKPIYNEEVVEEFETSEETVSNEDVAEVSEASELDSYEDVTEELEALKPVPNEVVEESEALKPVPTEVAEESEALKPVPNEVAEEAEASKPVPIEVAEETEASKPVAKVELGLGVSIISVILASLIFVFRRLKRREQALNESAPTMPPPSGPILTEVQESIIAETLEKVKKCYLSKKDEVVKGRIEKAAESFIDSSLHSGGRVSEDLYRRRAAPSVQLLSEFMVEESGSSLRSCSVLKSKAVDDGGEESKISVSMSEMKRGASSILQEDQSYLSEFSNADSASYGSFTTKEKITRRDGEDITTPVRRSSRIRKSVTSS